MSTNADTGFTPGPLEGAIRSRTPRTNSDDLEKGSVDYDIDVVEPRLNASR